MATKSPWKDWQILETIGRGSYGAVYKITRTQYGVTELAAMKVISIPNDPDMIEKDYSCGYDKDSIKEKYKSYLDVVLNEYQLMMKIKGCANIVRCDDISVQPHDDGIGWDVFIRMEYLNAADKIFTGKVKEETVIKLGTDICNALDVCGREDIIHRDIKPSNILANDHGDFKLGDFGVSRVLNDEDTYGTKGIGTYNFMAPEVYNGEKYGKAADIYSLGMVMYWLLNDKAFPFLSAGKAPTAKEMSEAREKRFGGEPLPRPARGTDELVSVVLKACSFKPEDRYDSAKEMWSDLFNISYSLTSRVDITAVPGKEAGPSSDGTADGTADLKTLAGDEGTAVIDPAPFNDDTVVIDPVPFNDDTVVVNPVPFNDDTVVINPVPSGDGTVPIKNSNKKNSMPVPPPKPPVQDKTEKSSKGYLVAIACVFAVLLIAGVCFALANNGKKAPAATSAVEQTSETAANTSAAETTTAATTTTTTSVETTEPDPTNILGLPAAYFSYDGEYLEVDSSLFGTSYTKLNESTKNRLTNYREWSESDSDVDAVCDLGEFAFKFMDEEVVSFVCIYPNRGLTLDDISGLYLDHLGDYDDVSYDKSGNIKSCEWMTSDDVHIHIWWDKSANCVFAEYEKEQ